MRKGHLIQADVALPDLDARFWMDSCAGRDLVAMHMLNGGWTAFEAPMPLIVALWCRRLRPTFIDIGANTGFYSLLALSTGARTAHAFEPVAEIMEVLESNATMSEVRDRLHTHALALSDSEGTTTLYLPTDEHGLVESSASLNREFRQRHSATRQVARARLDLVLPPAGWDGRPVVIKIDVESHEPAVLRGAREWLLRARPAVICEILPDADVEAVADQFAEAGYRPFVPTQGDGPGEARLVATARIQPGLGRRDHVFLPSEAVGQWLGTAHAGPEE